MEVKEAWNNDIYIHPQKREHLSTVDIYLLCWLKVQKPCKQYCLFTKISLLAEDKGLINYNTDTEVLVLAFLSICHPSDQVAIYCVA